MASLSGPEQFIINLLVLLLLMVAVVLLADRLLKNKSWMRFKRKEKKVKKKAVNGTVLEQKVRKNNVRLTRNYLDSGRGQGAVTEQEKDFSNLYGEANEALTEDPRGERTSKLMKKIDDQYIRMLSYFSDRNDRPTGLHMEHNYLWLKYRQRADIDPNGAFMMLVQSLSKLMERQGVKAYEIREFNQIMERYDGTIGSLEQTRGFNVNNATVAFFSFSARLNLMLREHPDPVAQEAVGKAVKEFVQVLLERHYLRMVQSHFLMELKVEHIQAITDQVEGLRRVQESLGKPDPDIHMVCHYLVCRLRMAQLRIMATLEPSPGRAQDIHEAHMRKLSNDAAASGSESMRWAAMRKAENNRSLLAQAEVVNLLAAHFQATYGKRLVLESWSTMEAVKRKVVQAAVEERTPLAEELLSSCDEEWRVLNASTKEWLARQVRKTSLRTEEGAPPTPAADGGLKSLRLMSYVQEEGISDQAILQVLEAMKGSPPPKKSWPPEHRLLMKAVTGRNGGVRKLEVPGQHYAGALIGPHLALLIKTTEDRIDAGTITVAVESCQKAGAREIVFCVNFSTELVTAETLRRFFTIAEKRYRGLTFSAVDSKDLTASLIDCLRDNGTVPGIELAPDLCF